MFWRCLDQDPKAMRTGRRTGWRAAMLLAAAMPGFGWQAFAATEVQVRIAQQPEGLKIILTWASSVQFQSVIKGRELVLQFDQALSAPQLEALPKSHPSWIEGIAAGYDSVLVLAARNVKYQVLSQGREITIDMLPMPNSPAAPAEQARGRLRLELQQVRLFATRGRFDQALKLATRLRREHPEDLNVLSSLASVEKQIGRWRKAEQLITEGWQREPENGDLQSQRREIGSEQSSRASGGEERKTVPGRWSEQLTRLSAQARVTPSLRVGANYDVNQVQANDVQRLDGSHGKFDSFRQRGEFYVQNDFLSGLMMRGSVYRGLSGVGGGFAMSYPDYFGRTTLQVDFQRPFWEFVEGLVDGGVRDRVELKRSLRAGTRWNGWATLAGNRYGLVQDRDVARSIGADAGFNFLMSTTNPQVSLEYGFDKEHRLTIDSRKTTAGLSFFPIPMRDREVHSLSAVLGAQLLTHLRTDGYGGFAYDRMGGNGPFMGMRLTYDRPSDFSAQLWFDRRLNTINTGETVNRIGGRLMWRF